jgi:hypothetical protein
MGIKMAKNKNAADMVYEKTAVFAKFRPKKFISFELFAITAAMGKYIGNIAEVIVNE